MNNLRSVRLKEKLSAGAITAGMWVNLPSPVSFEVVADSGFDWVVVDSEHFAFNKETLLHMLMAFKTSETVAIIRVPWNEPAVVKQALDMGFDGIMFPGVGSLKDVKRAVLACRYPPLGQRGFGPIRISGYTGAGQVEYARHANERVICAIQIEDISAKQDIDEIVKVPGIDWVMFGPNDLSGTVGSFLNPKHPDVREAVHEMQKKVKAAGLPYSGWMGSPEAIEDAMQGGCQLIFTTDDISCLQQGMAAALKGFGEIVSRVKK